MRGIIQYILRTLDRNVSITNKVKKMKSTTHKKAPIFRGRYIRYCIEVLTLFVIINKTTLMSMFFAKVYKTFSIDTKKAINSIIRTKSINTIPNISCKSSFTLFFLTRKILYKYFFHPSFFANLT